LGASGRVTVLVAAPYVPFGPALWAANLVPSKLLRVQASSTTERLWAAEQALRCTDVACVLLWLEQAQSAQLRRLHLAAQEHAKPLFVLRPERAQHESSPAPLRLWLRWQEGRSGQGGQKGAVPPLWVRVLKRRGPPLEVSLPLITVSSGLQALLAASHAQARRRRREQAVPGSLEPAHAVDRLASLV
jgi:protein ImuA